MNGYSIIIFKLLVFASTLSFSGKVFAIPDELSKNEIKVGIAGFPISNLFYIGFDEYSEAVTSLVLEPLIRLSLIDLSPEPALASSFSATDDRKTFTFEIDPKASFSNGDPVTAEDVIFTFEALRNPENRAQAYASLFDRIDTCKSTSPHQISFHARVPIEEGLALFETLYVLPKKLFSNKRLYKDFNETFIGSGPYLFESVDWGKSIILKRNPLYWAKEKPTNKDRYNLNQIEFQVQSDPTLSLQMLLRNEIDFLYFLSAKSWAKDTQGPLFQKGTIRKLEVRNHNPFATAGIAWNLRKPLFQGKETREALTLLFNRKRFIRDLFYDQYLLSTGIAPVTSVYHHPDNRPAPYNPAKAQAILKKQGWVLNTKGLLEKNGKTFSFEILTGNPPAAKFLTLYQEDLRKVGIEAKIRIVDWGTYLRLRGQGQFDALDFSRNRNFQMNDLDTTWHSTGAPNPDSGNVTGFSNRQVDELLEKLHSPLAPEKRLQTLRALDKLIANEYPISFSWEPAYLRIAYWDKYDFRKPGYFPYSRWSQVFLNWKWNKQKAEKVLLTKSERPKK
jgi:microcin C transport system substrate-binding protein